MIKLDPRIKILIVAVISTLAILMDSTISLLYLLIIDIIIDIVLGVNLLNFYRRARYLLIIVISIALMQSIFNRTGTPIVSIYNFTVFTDYGLNLGLQFILRMSIVISSAMIIATSNIREITDGLIKMKLPYELAFMMSISIRFLPDFKNDFVDRMTALRLRGIELSDYSIFKKIKIYVYLLTPAVSSSIIKSQMLAIAMESRAFRIYNKRTMLRDLQMRLIDYVVMTISIAAFALTLYLLYR